MADRVSEEFLVPGDRQRGRGQDGVSARDEYNIDVEKKNPVRKVITQQ
jgi:hypothetical protein